MKWRAKLVHTPLSGHHGSGTLSSRGPGTPIGAGAAKMRSKRDATTKVESSELTGAPCQNNCRQTVVHVPFVRVVIDDNLLLIQCTLYPTLFRERIRNRLNQKSRSEIIDWRPLRNNCRRTIVHMPFVRVEIDDC